MMKNHRAPYMRGCTAIVVFFGKLLLKMDSNYPMFFFSRPSRVRFIRIRVGTIISGLMSVEGLLS